LAFEIFGIKHAHPHHPLSKGIGWLSWNRVKQILEVTKRHFGTEAERKFVEDLIVYLEYKTKEGERIRIERKQMSFW